MLSEVDLKRRIVLGLFIFCHVMIVLCITPILINNLKISQGPALTYGRMWTKNLSRNRMFSQGTFLTILYGSKLFIVLFIRN